MNHKAARKALQSIAKSEGVSLETVRREIEYAIAQAQKSPDPYAREFWNSIAKEGKAPTPEDVIVEMANRIYGTNEI